MQSKPFKLVGQLLVQKSLITNEQLALARVEQEKSGGFLGTILIGLGFINEDTFYQVLAEQFGTTYLKLKDINILPETIELIPVKFATHYKLIPVDVEKDIIVVATEDPLDIHTLDDLKLLLKKEIKMVLANAREISNAIKKYYGVGAETIEEIGSDKTRMKQTTVLGRAAEDIAASSEEASIISFVNEILMEAYNDNATDIHIEPYEDELRIRYRVDGILYETKIPPTIKNFQSSIVSRIKIMANLDIAEKRLPQDGRIKVKIAEEDLDLRVSILPTQFGEAVMIRLLSSKVFLGLEKLGLLKSDQMIMEKLILQPHGIIFVTGPTGSGKTTTLYAALSRINSTEKKIITIEDPVEYQLKGIVQIQIQPKIDLTFAQGLRSMLRHDPDVMMIGEVRDFETAEIAIRSALTGHLVFSTLHTNDAAGGITRLIDTGVKPFLITSFVNAFMAVRLVRVICEKCKIQMPVDAEILKELDVPKFEISKAKIFSGRGCEACKRTGYRGRTAIYEILVMSEPIRELVLKSSSSEQIKQKAISLGMKTLGQDGWKKIQMGITTPQEVMRVTQKEDL